MNIKFLVCISGSEYSHKPGDIAVIEQAEALRLIEAGYAMPVPEAAETAVASTATEKRGKRK